MAGVVLWKPKSKLSKLCIYSTLQLYNKMISLSLLRLWFTTRYSTQQLLKLLLQWSVSRQICMISWLTLWVNWWYFPNPQTLEITNAFRMRRTSHTQPTFGLKFTVLAHMNKLGEYLRYPVSKKNNNPQLHTVDNWNTPHDIHINTFTYVICINYRYMFLHIHSHIDT